MPLPEGHRFPIAKYAAIRDGVVARALLPDAALEEPDRCERAALGLVHTAGYVDAVLDGTPMPCTAEDGLQAVRMVEAARLSAEGGRRVLLSEVRDGERRSGATR